MSIEVTVGVITYMHEKYIRKCLDSLLNQKTTFEYKVVVADDASPDNTRSILLDYKEKYGEKLCLILHDKNLGTSMNGKSIWPYIEGKYYASCEGDDFWLDENKLQKQYDILEANPGYSACCCNYMSVSSDNTIRCDAVLKRGANFVKTMKDWMREGYSLHTCTVFRRNSVFPLNDERYIALKSVAPTMGDVITFTLLYDAGDIYVINEVMAAHRVADSTDVSSFSIKDNKDPLLYTRMFISICDALEDYFGGKYNFSPRRCNRVAMVITKRIKGKVTYSRSEMREILSQFSFSEKLEIYRRVFVKLFRAACEKIRKFFYKLTHKKQKPQTV